MSKTLSFNLANGNGSIQLNDESIIYVFTDTLGALVVYEESETGNRDQIVVSDAPADIASVSSNLYAITVPDSVTMYVATERTRAIEEVGSVATVYYDEAGAQPKPIVTSQTLVTVQAAFNTKAGVTSYSFDEVNATNNTISLAAANGDKTSEFTLNTAFQVSGTNFDGFFVVQSSAFSGGKTVITLKTGYDVPSGASTAGLVTL